MVQNSLYFVPFRDLCYVIHFNVYKYLKFSYKKKSNFNDKLIEMV